MTIPFSQFTALDSLDAATLEESAVITEALSGTVSKAAAAGILLKLSQLKQKVAQDRTATPADRTLAEMVVWLAGLMAISVAAVTNDATLANKGRSAGSR